jgi:hypothetical protein
LECARHFIVVITLIFSFFFSPLPASSCSAGGSSCAQPSTKIGKAQLFALNGSPPSNDARDALMQTVDRDEGPMAQDSKPSQSEGIKCTERLQYFISELDNVLARNPSTLETVSALLNKYFPLTGCKLEEVRIISETSKYFASTYDQPSLVVFSFSSANRVSPGQSGFDVSFAISKTTGNTQLPFAKIHKGN